MGMSGESMTVIKVQIHLQNTQKNLGWVKNPELRFRKVNHRSRDEYSVQSAIGKGIDNDTVSQLNRYVAAVADRGTVHKLTLLDKTTDVNGKVIKEYEPEVTNTIEAVSDHTWNLIHQGMIAMVQDMPQFNGMEVSMAGKTGTAQQSEVHPGPRTVCWICTGRETGRSQLPCVLQMDIIPLIQQKSEEIS